MSLTMEEAILRGYVRPPKISSTSRSKKKSRSKKEKKIQSEKTPLKAKSHPKKFRSGWKFTSQTPSPNIPKKQTLDPDSPALKIPNGGSGYSSSSRPRRCPICRKEGKDCEHYETVRFKGRTLIRCGNCMSYGHHWSSHCPKPRVIDPPNPKLMEVLLKHQNRAKKSFGSFNSL